MCTSSLAKKLDITHRIIIFYRTSYVRIAWSLRVETP